MTTRLNFNHYQMRDLIYKNLTSPDRTRKIVSSLETVVKQGMRTVIRKRVICKAVEIKDGSRKIPLPQVYACRVSDHANQHNSFFCRMKASLYTETNGRLFLLSLGRSLKIDSRPINSLLP